MKTLEILHEGCGGILEYKYSKYGFDIYKCTKCGEYVEDEAIESETIKQTSPKTTRS